MAGGLVWAHSFQLVCEPIKKRKKPADGADDGSDPVSRWYWWLLQYDSLRSEAEIYEREWDYIEELEPGEETASGSEGWSGGTDPAFELVAEEEQLESLCAVPDFSDRVVAEALGWVGREPGPFSFWLRGTPVCLLFGVWAGGTRPLPPAHALC